MKKINVEVAEYLEYCEKIRGMSKSTMSMKQNILGRFLKNINVENVGAISNRDFNGWVKSEMARGITMQSMNMYNSVIVAMIRYFQDTGMRTSLNLGLIRKMKGMGSKRIFYTASEIFQVVEKTEIETGLMIMVMFETGMRIAELTRLKTSEIRGRRIDFVGKGMRMREVYMSVVTARKMFDFLDGREGYVWGFDSLNGEPPTVNTVRQRMSTAFLEAGFEGFYPHALRHSFATALQKKGASVDEIKEMMGHSSIATTERYLHGFEGRMEELFDKYQVG